MPLRTDPERSLLVYRMTRLALELLLVIGGRRPVL
jgi:hypothetical protein